VLVCGGTGCHSSNFHQVVEALQAEVVQRGLGQEVRIVPTGCRGFCSMGPVMMIYPEGILYCQVQPDDVRAAMAPRTKSPAFSVTGKQGFAVPTPHSSVPL
jgi:(2Fe-2S) ferredoxin